MFLRRAGGGPRGSATRPLGVLRGHRACRRVWVGIGLSHRGLFTRARIGPLLQWRGADVLPAFGFAGSAGFIFAIICSMTEYIEWPSE